MSSIPALLSVAHQVGLALEVAATLLFYLITVLWVTR